jgi:hypothetical protein
MHNSPLTRRFVDALDEACLFDPSLTLVKQKTYAFFEDYAVSKGLTVGRMLVIHVCDEAGNIRPDLERHLMEVYLLSAISRPSYLSNVKRIAKAIVRRKNVSVITVETAGESIKSLLSKNIPKYMQAALPYIPRARGSQWGKYVNLSKRLKAPYSEFGECLLLAMLKVHDEYKVRSLKSLFIEHLGHLREAVKEVAGQRAPNVQKFIYR